VLPNHLGLKEHLLRLRPSCAGCAWSSSTAPQDRKVLTRINTLIADIQRNGNEGIGKPEPLKHGFQAYWSRRITDEHRLVCKIAEDEIRIAACRYHYQR
jgi:toxin YoeB